MLDYFFFSSRRRHTRLVSDWSSDVCSSDLRAMSKEEFRREVEKELTGKETEPWEIVYFKLYKSQIPVIEQAIDTAALMLRSEERRVGKECRSRWWPDHKTKKHYTK